MPLRQEQQQSLTKSFQFINQCVHEKLRAPQNDDKNNWNTRIKGSEDFQFLSYSKLTDFKHASNQNTCKTIKENGKQIPGLQQAIKNSLSVLPSKSFVLMEGCCEPCS